MKDSLPPVYRAEGKPAIVETTTRDNKRTRSPSPGETSRSETQKRAKGAEGWTAEMGGGSTLAELYAEALARLAKVKPPPWLASKTLHEWFDQSMREPSEETEEDREETWQGERQNHDKDGGGGTISMPDTRTLGEMLEDAKQEKAAGSDDETAKSTTG